MRRPLLFLNLAHAYDHFFLLILPTAVLCARAGLGDVLWRGAGARHRRLRDVRPRHLPAGWLGDCWSRTHLMSIFFIGIGSAAILAGLGHARAGARPARPVRLDLPSGRYRARGPEREAHRPVPRGQRRVRQPRRRCRRPGDRADHRSLGLARGLHPAGRGRGPHRHPVLAPAPTTQVGAGSWARALGQQVAEGGALRRVRHRPTAPGRRRGGRSHRR